MIYRLLILSFLIIPIDAFSSDAISHAPLGVTADHFHKKGEWMVSLRVTNMEMKNNAHDETLEDDKLNHVIIKNGILLQGRIDSKIMNSGTRGLIHIIFIVMFNINSGQQ